MPENTETENKTPTAEAEQPAAQASEATAKTAVTFKPSDQLSEEALEGVTGGVYNKKYQ
jgi:hypothetical protein